MKTDNSKNKTINSRNLEKSGGRLQGLWLAKRGKLVLMSTTLPWPSETTKEVRNKIFDKICREL